MIQRFQYSVRLVLIVCLVLILGCDGSSSDGISVGDFRGVWDVRYNLSLDDCFLVESGIPGFVDVHIIDQDDSNVTLEASSGSGVPLRGAVREDNSLATEQVLEGDIFGIGLFCELHQAISYEPTNTNKTTSLFVRTIACEDGYFCESRGIGESKRR